jgi:hypothetical protein
MDKDGYDLPTQPIKLLQPTGDVKHFISSQGTDELANSTILDPYVISDNPPTELLNYESNDTDRAPGIITAAWNIDKLASDDRDKL